MKILKKLMNLFKKEKIHLSVVEYDKLIESKLENIRKFMRSKILIRDDDDLFNKQFQEAFLAYEKLIKKGVYEVKDTDGKIIKLSPINVLISFQNDYSYKRKRVWYKGVIRRIKFKIQSYWQHLMLMNKIRKMKRLFPDVKSNQMTMNLIGASKLNKRMIEKNL
jgi:hypothetical protein